LNSPRKADARQIRSSLAPILRGKHQEYEQGGRAELRG